MTGGLLWRGMLAGVLAALLATLFARAVAEPLVDRAIAFETRHGGDHHRHDATDPDARDDGDHDGGARDDDAHDDGDHRHHADAGATPAIGRATQKGAGLVVAMAVYGAAVGGVFALLFAFGHGRIARVGPRALAAGLAVAAFVVVAVAPALKYPPNPPAVGRADTIELRTVAYFAMIAASIVAAGVAARLHGLLRDRLGGFDAALVAGAGYVAIVAAVQAMLPVVDEVPADFPATLLWRYRIAAIGMQAILWAAIGLAFGMLAERRLRR